MQKKFLMIALILITPFIFSGCLKTEPQKNAKMEEKGGTLITPEPTLSQDTTTGSLEKDLNSFTLEEETFE